MSQWPNLCDTFRSFDTFFSSITNFSSIQWSSLVNNLWERQNSLSWQCMMYYRNLWNSYNGNTWPLYVHMAEVTMHGRPDVTLVERAAHHVSRSFFFLPQENVCGIHTSATIQLALIIHVEIRGLQGETLYPLYHRANPGFKVCALYRTEFQRPLGRFTKRLLCQILKNMAILRFDLGNSLPRSQVRSVVKSIHETNEPTYSYCFYFVQIGPCILKTLTIYHLTLKFQGQGQCRIQGICISWFSGHVDGNCGKNIQ